MKFHSICLIQTTFWSLQSKSALPLAAHGDRRATVILRGRTCSNLIAPYVRFMLPQWEKKNQFRHFRCSWLVSRKESGSRGAYSIPASSAQQFGNETQEHDFGVETAAFPYCRTVTFCTSTASDSSAFFPLCYLQRNSTQPSSQPCRPLQTSLWSTCACCHLCILFLLHAADEVLSVSIFLFSLSFLSLFCRIFVRSTSRQIYPP